MERVWNQIPKVGLIRRDPVELSLEFASRMYREVWFQVTFDEPGFPKGVLVRLSGSHEGEPLITGLMIDASFETDDLLEPVTSSSLRSLRLGGIQKLFATLVADERTGRPGKYVEIHDQADPAEHPWMRVMDVAAVISEAPRRVGRAGRPAAHYKWVADEYKKAQRVARGKENKYLSEHLVPGQTIPDTTIRNWVRTAREFGMLPPKGKRSE